MTNVLFFGSRDWENYQAIQPYIEELRPYNDIVIHGGASGADQIAGRLAHDNNIHVAVVNALWHQRGHRAGPMRNKTMLMLGIERAVGFDLGGPGTKNMAKLLKSAGIPYILVKP